MSHIVSAVINALTAGRWLEAAPLFVELLEAGQVATLSDLAFYETASGQQCTDTRVRSILETRLGLLERAQKRFADRSQWYEAERLAEIVREHGHPCRVVMWEGVGYRLKVASSIQKRVRKWQGEGSHYWTWEFTYLCPDHGQVYVWLGYGEVPEQRVG